MRHFVRVSISGILLSFLFTALVLAQSDTTGAVAGVVRNPAGAALPAVTVTLVNVATNQTHTAASDSSGSFRFSLLPPGLYGVKFAGAGFKPAQMTAFMVDVSEVPNLEVVLEPGSATEPMECRCRLILSATSSSGTLVDQKTITAVPLTTRNFTQILSMSSGSAADVNNAGTLGRGTQTVNVNGNTTAGGYTIDGAFAPSTVPNPDTISEFKIQTSQYDAGFGALVPNTNLITKGGENQFHGDAWEFVRNDILNANAFFRNATGQPKPNLKQNQYGGALGGKVKKDKLFFFGSWQGTRQTNGLDPTSVATVILPALTNDRSAGTIASQFCPANHVISSGQDPRYLTFAGGKQLDCRNQNTGSTAAINPVALRILQTKNADGSWLVPTPQTVLTAGANNGMGFSSYSFPSTYHENQFVGNSDYVISPKHTLSWRGFFARLYQFRSLGAPGGATVTPVLPGSGAPQALDAHDYVTSGKLSSVLTKTLVNEVRMTFTRNNSFAWGVGTPDAGSVGMTAVDPLFKQAPEVTMLGPMGTFRLFGNGANDFSTTTNTYSWTDNLNWVHGRQTIRTGGFFFRQENNRLDTGAARGKITFQTFPDFLIGLSAADNLSPGGRSNIQTVGANEGIGPAGEVQYKYRRNYASGFVQDDVKLRPALTLNFGLRWEYIAPSSDQAGALGNVWTDLLRQAAVPPVGGTLAGNVVAANYDASLVNPYTGKPFGPAPAGVTVSSNGSFYRNGTPRDKWAPRFGFAWQPFGTKGRVAVRGGYGWFFQAPPFSSNAANTPLFTAQPFAQSFTNTDASNGASTLSKPFPTTTLGFIPRTPTSQLSDRVAGPAYQVARLQQWNLSTQTKLGGNYTLDVGYVGSYGDQLLIGVGQNQPRLASAANSVNCGYTGVATDCITTNTAQNAKLRVPILGETPTALLASQFTGKSWYHSMQATLRKQLSHGLTFQAAYTWSKATNNTSIYNDLNNLNLNWARATFDRTHRVITNFDYQMPALAQGRGLRSTMLNGWTLAGIVIIQSGLPMTFTDPAGGGVYGRAATSTVTLCPGTTAATLATPGGVEERLGRWVNTSGFCAPQAIGSDGSTGYGNAGQSILNGPQQVNTDFSLGKTTRVGGVHEDAQLAFRMEFYNALNHPQFANPGTTLGTANFGVVTQTSVAPRLIQFGMKYVF